MKLVNKISLGYGVVFLIILLGLVAVRQSLSIQEGYRKAVQEDRKVNAGLEDLELSGLRFVISTNEAAVIRLIASGKSPVQLKEAVRQEESSLQEGIGRYREALRRYGNYVEKKALHERPFLEKISSSGENLIHIGKQYDSIIRKGNRDEALSNVKEGFEEAEQGFLSAVNATLTHRNEEIVQEEEEMKAAVTRYGTFVLLSGFFAFLIALIMGRVIAGKIARPIEALKKAALRVGRGELEVRVNVESRDEIGQLAETFNQMVSDLNLLREALRESGIFARSVINSVPDSIVVVNPDDYTIVGVNKVYLEEIGLTEDQAVGQPCYLATHGLEKPCSDFHEACALELVMKKGDPVTIERVLNRNGKENTLEISASPIRDENGGIVRIILAARDITDRKHTEQALQEKHLELQEMYRIVEGRRREWEISMDALNDMIVLINDEEKIWRYNRAFRIFTGLPEHELDGADWNGFLLEEEIRVGTVFGEGGMEFFHEPTQRWYVQKFCPYRDPVSGFSGAVITIQDSTELKYMAEELERTNLRVKRERSTLQRALDQLSVLIQGVIRDRDFSPRFINPHMVRCHEVKGCARKKCPCYGKAEAVRCWQISGTFCGGAVQGDFAKKIQNCEECSVYQAATDDPVYRIGENFNNMMHLLQVKNRELEQAYSDLKSTQSQILQSEKMASIGQLAAGVAHEINNPMGFITSNLGTLEKYIGKFSEFIEAQSAFLKEAASPDILTKIGEQRKKLKLDYVLEDIPELIAESQEGAERVKKIVQNLKSFSRVDQAECKMTDLHECLESTLNIVWNELKYKCTVKKEYGEIPRTQCHPQELNQVFMNLLVNAAQAIEKQGEITIRTGEDAGMIRVSISDTGSGIPPDKVERIFEPFFTTKEVGKGTGLGLSICYDIVKKHEGEIDVTSEVGRGTTFTVSIPVVSDKEMERDKEKETVYG